MDIHQPSRMTHIIAPIPASSEGHKPLDSTTVPKTKEELLELMSQRDILEAELRTLGAILDANKVTMKTTLTTFDGYPRDDIDVPLIRITRSKIVHLKNDYKALMTRIEKGLHHFHANITAEEANSLAEASQSSAKTTTTPSTSSSAAAAAISSAQTQGAPVPSSSSSSAVPGSYPNTEEGEEDSGASDFLLPFAEVDQIFPNSPASSCGLLLGDKIKRFGNITSSNHERLTRVAQFVGSHENREIKVLVGRTSFQLDGLVEMEENVEVKLIPRKDWGGRGTLGCHLKLL
ncbi:26S proteasome non-ATPase regulatory subunit 9 [Peziza echinospora]|nr:26S proteasome non-ATPase regulatory subunit 9 [Peziza echinospora]